MSDTTDRLTQWMLQVIAQVKSTTPADLITAKVTKASVDASTGARSIFVAYQGATDIPTMWTPAFDVTIQGIAGANGDLTKLKDVEVLLATSVSPPCIVEMIVRS